MRALWPLLLIVLIAPLIQAPHPAAGAPPPAEVSVAIPVEVIAATLRNALPLELNTNRQLTGSLKLVSVENLVLGANRASFAFRLEGRDVGYKAEFGGQALELNLGNVHLAMLCDATLRFDPARHAILVRPSFREAAGGSNQRAAQVLPLITPPPGSEFPIPLERLDPFVTRIADRRLTVNLEIASVTTVPGELRIAIRPRVSP
jgi:hypothetical protein